MAMENFIANGQAYFYYESNGTIHVKLGAYRGSKPQKLAIAELKSLDEYPFGKKPVILQVCGKDFRINEMTDLELYLKLDEEFGDELLW